MEEEEDPFDPDTKGEIGSLFYFVLCMTAFQRNSVVVAQAKKTSRWPAIGTAEGKSEI